jgi:hypothetical protein
MLKLSDNPPMLSPGLKSPEQAKGPWRVAHTKARNEKAFAFDLIARGVAYFLPLLERVNVSGGRKRHVLHPLFPSYVFFSGGERARYEALATNRLCRAIEAPDQAGLLGELSSLSRALASQAPLEIYPHVAVGRRCRISGGAFEGFEGVVVATRSGVVELVLQVSMLGRGAVMEIDAALVEPLRDSTTEREGLGTWLPAVVPPAARVAMSSPG